MTIIDENEEKLLQEIENSVDKIKIIKKENKIKIKDKVINFPYSSSSHLTLKNNLIKFLNSKLLTYDDVKNYCKKVFGENGERKAYNILESLSDPEQDIRAATVQIICDLLNVKIIVEAKSDKNEESDINEEDKKRKPIRIEILQNVSYPDLILKIINYINNNSFYYADLISFLESKNKLTYNQCFRRAYNVINAIKYGNLHISSIEELCEFLNIDLVLVGASDDGEESNN